MNKAKGWLVTVSTAALLGFTGWVALSIIDLQSQAAVAAVKSQDLSAWLERIERKLDRALERR